MGQVTNPYEVDLVRFGEATSRKMALRFLPPLMELSDHRGIFIYHWKLFELAFQLPDPRAFPAMGPFPPEDAERLNRYLEMCERLAKSRLWTYPTTWTESFENTSMIDRPDDETLTGIVTGFRQVYRDDDASFGRAKNLLMKRSRILREPVRTRTVDGLKVWGDAAAKLEKAGIGHYADAAAALRYRGAPLSELSLDEGARYSTLDEMFEVFGYGDLIHWDKKRRNERARIRENLDLEVMFMGDFLELLMGYSMLALGFSAIVKAALRTAASSSLGG